MEKATEQISSTNKIISLHLERCKNGCPHSQVCYLRRREPKQGFPLPLNFREDILEQGYTVHEALCTPLTLSDKDLLTRYSNYNITISFPDFIESKITKGLHIDQIQVSVYSETQVSLIGNNILKLFLVKDLKTFREATSLVVNNNIRNVHFNIDQNYNSVQLLTLQNTNRNVTLDTCLSSWIINGECPYTNNYIDISHDWTVRKCPFSINGIPIPKDIINKKRNNYHDLFSLINKQTVCSYEKRFSIRGKNDGR